MNTNIKEKNYQKRFNGIEKTHQGDKEARLKERLNSDFLKRNHGDKKLIIVRWKV
jgi:hypothetical protein